jgi:hypothetical protein
LDRCRSGKAIWMNMLAVTNQITAKRSRQLSVLYTTRGAARLRHPAGEWSSETVRSDAGAFTIGLFNSPSKYRRSSLAIGRNTCSMRACELSLMSRVNELVSNLPDIQFLASPRSEQQKLHAQCLDALIGPLQGRTTGKAAASRFRLFVPSVEVETF